MYKRQDRKVKDVDSLVLKAKDLNYYGREVRSELTVSVYLLQRNEWTVLLWPPCVADADIIFLPYGFFLLSSSFLFLA